MQDLVSANGAREARLTEGKTIKKFARAVAASTDTAVEVSTTPSTAGQPLAELPKPKFYGVETPKDFELTKNFPKRHKTGGFTRQWQLQTARTSQYRRL